MMMKINKTARMLILTVVTTVLTISFGFSNLKADTLEDVNALLPLAADGDGEALDRAIDILAKLKLEQPDNAQVLAYLGSAYGIKAGISWNPLRKGQYANQSVRYLDIALEMAPDDLAVRLHRARVNLHFPFWMGRKDDAVEDLIVVDKHFRESPTPMLAKDMLELEFYEVLIEEAPDRGDWAAGKSLAEKLAQ